MRDETLATIGVQIERLREELREGSLDRAAVILWKDGQVYLSLKARSKEDGKEVLGGLMLEVIKQVETAGGMQ